MKTTKLKPQIETKQIKLLHSLQNNTNQCSVFPACIQYNVLKNEKYKTKSKILNDKMCHICFVLKYCYYFS